MNIPEVLTGEDLVLVTQIKKIRALNVGGSHFVVAVPNAGIQLLNTLPTQHLILHISVLPELFIYSPNEAYRTH
jgi:flagellar biogenesis protein FliO